MYRVKCKWQEEALQRQQKERLEDLEKAEKSAEAALELSRQEPYTSTLTVSFKYT